MLRLCRKYLNRVQNSAFEGEITQSKLEELKKKIEAIIVPRDDGVRIYRFESVRFAKTEVIGSVKKTDNII